MGGTAARRRAVSALRLPIIVAVVAAAGLVAIVAPIDGRADATPSTCTTGVSTSNALGAATGWTEFVEGNGTRTSESEGAIAYGGNHSASGMTVGTRLPSSTAASAPTLVVAGTHGTYNLQRGSAYLSPKSGVNFNGGTGTGYLASNPIDFASAFTDLRATSASWAAATANGTVTTGTAGGNTALVLTGTDASLNVFNLTSAQVTALGSGTHVAYNVPSGSTVLVNVPGTSPTIGGQMWLGSGSSAQQVNDSNTIPAYAGIVWNFAQATSVTISVGSAWAGTILAPNAALTIASAGHTIGQMIAKSFSSGYETHQNLFPSTACVPGTTPPPPTGTSDVTITKTASSATPTGGSAVTYTLTARNVGTATATGVVVRDQLPTGVTFDSAGAPCTQAAGVVTCSIPDLAAGASTSLWIKVVANPVAGAGSASDPQAYHWVTPYKAETQVDLAPGEQKSVTLSCNSGDILSDGQFRLDQVDQGTGTIADLHVLSSQTTALGTWKGIVRNDATGRAQGKAFIVCLPAYTEEADRQTGHADGHRHPLSADATLATVTQAYGVGSTATATVTCPTGTIPIAPGFDLSGGSATLAASEYDQVNHPRDWTFRLAVTAPTTATFSARCLRTTVGQVYGHTHELLFTHLVQTVTVSGNTAKEGDEFQVICPDDAKGVVATWDLPPGVTHFGNDPRLKTRAFRLYNQTGVAKTATVDLLCLHDRTSTEQMGTTAPVVVDNTATISSVSTDANAFNNSSTASISVQPGSATAGMGSSVRVSASSLGLRVVSSMPGRGAVTVRSAGTLLAQGLLKLVAGRATDGSLALTKAGRHRLAGLDTVTVRVDPTRGRAVTRTVRVLH